MLAFSFTPALNEREPQRMTLENPMRTDSTDDCRRFPLSPRERAGVRGKPTYLLPNASALQQSLRIKQLSRYFPSSQRLFSLRLSHLLRFVSHLPFRRTNHGAASFLSVFCFACLNTVLTGLIFIHFGTITASETESGRYGPAPPAFRVSAHNAAFLGPYSPGTREGGSGT